VLQFRIGVNCYARTSDGTRFGENKQDTQVNGNDSFADLYQPGHQSFPERLSSVLTSWLDMVQRGDWKVGANGVMGGVDKWKKADTEESSEKYVVLVTG
jgi:hypothetical protein